MDTKTLREYLEQIRLLETDVYTIDKTIEELQKSWEPLSAETLVAHRHPIPPKPVRPSEYPKRRTLFGLMFEYIEGGPLAPILAITEASEHDKKAAERKKLIQEVDKEIAEWEKQEVQIIALRESELPALRATVRKYNEKHEQKIQELQRNKDATIKALNKLYDLNIIYVKYRTLIPISMFCEYIDSQRREKLEGENGMYDLYEEEAMGKLILTELNAINGNLRTISYQLGEISRKLTGIQRNQIMTYEAIAEGNQIAADIRAETNAVRQQLIDNNAAIKDMQRSIDSVRNSAHITALNSDITARRTNAMARIAEYEFAGKHSPYINP